MAKMRMQGCAFYLPLETAYDQDVLFEHLQSVARAHYRVQLEISERCLLVSECGAQPQGCAECGRVLARGSVQHRADDHTLCTSCARRMIRALDRGAFAQSPVVQMVTGGGSPAP